MTKTDAIKKRTDETDSLPTLFARMADDLTNLFDAKLALLKIEVREDLAAYLRGSVMIVLGGVVVLVGFALLNVAIAFLISTLFQNTSLSQPVRYGLGFGITALFYLLSGGAMIVIYSNKLAAGNLVPERTISELKKDKDRIEEEI